MSAPLQYSRSVAARQCALLRAWNDGARPAQVTAEGFDACCVGMPLDIGILNRRGGLGTAADRCPVYRSIHSAIHITTAYELGAD